MYSLGRDVPVTFASTFRLTNGVALTSPAAEIDAPSNGNARNFGSRARVFNAPRFSFDPFSRSLATSPLSQPVSLRVEGLRGAGTTVGSASPLARCENG